MPTSTILRPTDRHELASLLAEALRTRQQLAQLDLSLLNNILAFEPDDMTIRVESGAALGTLQSSLAEHRQWIPIDPVDMGQLTVGQLTVGQLIDNDLSGPRRYGYGTIRDHVIGITVATAEGHLVKSGGSVVKNVAGFDLMRLFVGAKGSLGIVVDVTFRLRPLPDAEVFLLQRFESLTRADEILEQISRSPMNPVVLDMHNIDANEHTIVLGLAGSSEDVEYQRLHADTLGFATETDISYERRFTEKCAESFRQRISVLPSRLPSAIASLGPVTYVARAGNGIVDYIGEAPASAHQPESALMQRTRELFDPYGILPTANH